MWVPARQVHVGLRIWPLVICSGLSPIPATFTVLDTCISLSMLCMCCSLCWGYPFHTVYLENSCSVFNSWPKCVLLCEEFRNSLGSSGILPISPVYFTSILVVAWLGRWIIIIFFFCTCTGNSLKAETEPCHAFTPYICGHS